MTGKEISHSVSDLLRAIVRHNPDLQWNMQCQYSDGEDQTLVEISFYSRTRGSRMGGIVYHFTSGQVMNFYYAGLSISKPEHVIDLLLDIHNFEKEKQVTS